MPDIERYKELLRNYPLDLRLEVILGELLSDGISFDDIEIATNSVFARSYHYDIEKVEETEYPTTRKKRLRFLVNRDGLYDSLPEDLMHQPTSEQITNKERVIAEIKVQEAREKEARKFFLPYEQEYYRLRVKLELEERKFMFANSGQMNSEVLSMLWNFPAFLDEQEKAKLGLLMPVLHEVIGDKELGSYLVTHITNDDVEITEGHLPNVLFADAPSLNNTQLGNEFVLGGEYSFTEPQVLWKIKVEGMQNLTQYMPGGRKALVHEYLGNLIMPLEDEINFYLDISSAKEGFVLNEETSSARLGFVTYL